MDEFAGDSKTKSQMRSFSDCELITPSQLRRITLAELRAIKKPAFVRENGEGFAVLVPMEIYLDWQMLIAKAELSLVLWGRLEKIA